MKHIFTPLIALLLTLHGEPVLADGFVVSPEVVAVKRVGITGAGFAVAAADGKHVTLHYPNHPDDFGGSAGTGTAISTDGDRTWSAGADDWPMAKTADLWQERLRNGSFMALGIRWLPDPKLRGQIEAKDASANPWSMATSSDGQQWQTWDATIHTSREMGVIVRPLPHIIEGDNGTLLMPAYVWGKGGTRSLLLKSDDRGRNWSVLSTIATAAAIVKGRVGHHAVAGEHGRALGGWFLARRHTHRQQREIRARVRALWRRRSHTVGVGESGRWSEARSCDWQAAQCPRLAQRHDGAADRAYEARLFPSPSAGRHRSRMGRGPTHYQSDRRQHQHGRARCQHAARLHARQRQNQLLARYAPFTMTALAIASCLFVAFAASGADTSDSFGAEANPTGQPIGGGLGYTAGPKLAPSARQVDSLASIQQALAMAKPGEVIWIESNKVIDLADAHLIVPEKVTLAGDRGTKGSQGPLLTAGMSKLEWRIQLKPGARLSGVRLRGPNPLMRDIDAVNPPPSNYAIACVDAEVDNCDISQFQRGGIAMFRDSERAHIHHNHLHDIAAYPVLLGNGTGDCHVIEANRIEWAWHAIASNGSRGSGYTAGYNVFMRVTRPKLFDQSGPDPPNWCLDTHVNNGAPTKPPRPATRKLIAHHNTFLAHPDVKVGDGRDLLKTVGIYPKHDIYIGAGDGMTTRVEIHHNRFLMHKTSGSPDPNKPYGRAIRLVGLKGDAQLPDDPQPTKDIWKVSIGENRFDGKP